MKQNFSIDMNQPSSILQDFHTLLDFIGSDGELVSKKLLVFSTTTLLELNQQMTKPLAQDKKRPQQTTFPHITNIYKCAYLLGFFHYTDEGTRKRIKLNSSALESWNKLNLTEQYFTLLEKWLYGDPEDYRSFLAPINRLRWFQKKCLNRTGDEYPKIFKSEYKVGELLAGLELFGFIKINHAKPDVGDGWKINSLKQTQVGKFIFTILNKIVNESADDFLDRLYSKKANNNLFGVFQTYFSELKNPYFVKPDNSSRTGIYIFKVSLHGAWRRIAIGHEATLENLANVILDAFDFDNDHLHSFEFLDTAGAKREYMHPMGIDAEAFTDEIILAKLPLSIKASMKFIFDFGDWWEFKVLLEKLDENYQLKEDASAEIFDGKGNAPKQYPEWDED